MDLLPVLQPNKMIALCAPSAAREHIATLTAELALCGPVAILDGGNRFAAYQTLRMVRMRTADVTVTANRILVRRAFTCHQMLTLLESTPSLPQPYIILDLLASFYDENVPTEQVSWLLDQCLIQLDRLRMKAPLVLALAPPHAERLFLFERVCSRSEQVINIEPSSPVMTQPVLF